MKQILVQYYSRGNLGDDLFISILAKQFPNCRINLLTNPAYIPKQLDKNVRVHPFSFVHSFAGKIQHLLGWNCLITQRIDKIICSSIEKLRSANDAFVHIGGSIFMQKGTTEIPFATDQQPRFEYVSILNGFSKSFVIGANLGPIFTENYCNHIRNTFMNHTHICLRDYASYCLVKDLPHVQYAPDVIFLLPELPNTVDEENVVISVIDISKHTNNLHVIHAYYTLLCNTILEFNSRQIPVHLVSFCRREGDENAILRLMSMLPDYVQVSKHFYSGDAREILSLFSKASFVIASRFHSMILGVSFGKPVFPISYNCKTQNYLNDLCFRGKYATLSTLTKVTCEDVLYNYQNQIITDCTLHKKYAVNQFRALRTLIDKS